MADKDKEDAEDEEKKEGDTEGEEGEEGGKKKPGKKKLIIIGVAALVVILGGAGGAGYFLGWFGGHKDEDAAIEEGGEQGEAAGTTKAAPGQSVYYEMPEMLVNLNTGGKQASFLKMKVTLELADPKDVQVIEGHMPHITDAFNTYLRELRASDLAGSAGLYRLKEELLLRVNNAIQPTEVKNILFRDILVQ